MKPKEFEDAVRELRQRQRRYFRCRKDDPDKPKALELMRETERIIHNEVEMVRLIRPKNRAAANKREEFFLAVALMMDHQKEWMKSGGGNNWASMTAREAEKAVDKFLADFDEERRLEEQRRIEEIKKRQLTMF